MKAAELDGYETSRKLTIVTVANAFTTIHLIVFASRVPRSVEYFSVIGLESSPISLIETAGDFSIFRAILRTTSCTFRRRDIFVIQ